MTMASVSADQRLVRVIAEPTDEYRQELTGLGVLSAQVLAAAARVRDGLPLNGTERAVLVRASRLFKALAEQIRFVDGGGHGEAPNSLLSASVAVQLHDIQVPADIADYFESLAHKLRDLAKPNAPIALAEEVYTTFRAISLQVRASTGSSGHAGSAAESPSF